MAPKPSATAPTADELRRARRKRTFFLVRVSVLLFVLFVVVLYALRDIRNRRARNDWVRTLDVAVVLVHVEGRDRVDVGAIDAIKERAAALEERLQVEGARHNRSMPKPFHVRVFGPVDAATPPPTPAGGGAVELAKQALALKQWLDGVDPRVGVVPEHWDSRIYVTARRPASATRSFVEGQSEQDGRIGVVDVELDRDMVDFTLVVVAHVLMHTLGATDKYDESGRTLVPDGLAEPDRVPLYPQERAEVMARNRPLSASSEVVADELERLAVGKMTAKEIGWAR